MKSNIFRPHLRPLCGADDTDDNRCRTVYNCCREELLISIISERPCRTDQFISARLSFKQADADNFCRK